MVEYVNYSLVILAMLVAFLIWLQLPSRSRLPNDPMSLADTARQRQLTKKEQNQQARVTKPLSSGRQRVELDRKLSKVPTPWGWPRYEKNSFEGGQPALANDHAHSIFESFHHWADRLVQGKHTVDDEDYKRKREGWIRTLLEDRYGRSARKSPATNAKLSGVPTFPHGQMDNFSSGPVDKIEARLLRKGQTGEIPHYKRRLKLEMQTGLKDIKMPWGW